MAGEAYWVDQSMSGFSLQISFPDASSWLITQMRYQKKEPGILGLEKTSWAWSAGESVRIMDTCDTDDDELVWDEKKLSIFISFKKNILFFRSDREFVKWLRDSAVAYMQFKLYGNRMEWNESFFVSDEHGF